MCSQKHQTILQMKTNKNKPSKNKRRSVSSDILPATRRKARPKEIHHCQFTKTAFTPAAGDRYQVDSTCLDINLVLPGAHQELGQTYLNIMVDCATGMIVNANIDFEAFRVAPEVEQRNPHRPQLKGLVEQAFSRLLRPNPAN